MSVCCRPSTTCQTSFFLVVLLSVLLPGQAFGEEVVIPARKCSARSPNVVPADPGWDDLMVCHGGQGFVEWAFDLEAAGDRYMHVFVTSGEHRPIVLSINGQRLPGTCLDLNTGGFRSQTLQWATLGPFALRKGRNKVRIDAIGMMPHLGGLVVSDRRTGWNKNVFASLLWNALDPAIVALEGRHLEETRAALRKTFGSGRNPVHQADHVHLHPLL